MELEIARSERLATLLADESSNGLVALSPGGNILSWNRGAQELFGAPREQVLGVRFDAILAPTADHAAMEEAIEAAELAGSACVVTTALRGDGSLAQVDVILRRVEAGDESFLAVIATNVAERPRTAGSAFGEATVRRMLEAAPDSIVLTNRLGNIVYVNVKTEEQFGYRRQELIGKCGELLTPERFRARHCWDRAAFLADPRPRTVGVDRELFALRKDGTEFPVEINLSPLRCDEGLLVFSSIRDVTEHKKSEERFSVLLDSSPDAMVVVDETGHIVWMNAKTEQLFFYSRDELVGQRADILVPKRFRNLPSSKPANLEGLPVRSIGPRLEMEGIRKDHTEFPIEVTLNPIQTPEGTLISASIRDISERRENEKRTQDASVAKFDLLADISRGLRRPLDAIMRSTERMKGHGTESAGEQDRCLGDIVANSRRLSSLVDDLLELESVEAGKLKLWPVRVEVARLIGDVRAVLKRTATSRRVRLAQHIDADLSTVTVDAARIRQILYNYISVAIGSTPRGGRVQIRALAEGEGLFRLEVEGAGAGIAPESMERLFDVYQPFVRAPAHAHAQTRRKARAASLGFALTKRIAEAHGGTVEVRSEGGKGSVFSVVLPRTPSSGLARH